MATPPDRLPDDLQQAVEEARRQAQQQARDDSSDEEEDEPEPVESPPQPPEDVQETIDRRESGRTGLVGGRDDDATGSSSDDSGSSTDSSSDTLSSDSGSSSVPDDIATTGPSWDGSSGSDDSSSSSDSGTSTDSSSSDTSSSDSGSSSVPDDIATTDPVSGGSSTSNDSSSSAGSGGSSSDQSDDDSSSSDSSTGSGSSPSDGSGIGDDSPDGPSPSQPPEDVQETIDRRRDGDTGLAGGRDSSDTGTDTSSESNQTDGDAPTDDSSSVGDAMPTEPPGTDSGTDSLTSSDSESSDSSGDSSGTDLGLAINAESEQVQQQAREFKSGVLKDLGIDSRAGVRIERESTEDGQRLVAEVTDRGQTELQEQAVEDQLTETIAEGSPAGFDTEDISADDIIETQTNEDGEPEVAVTDERASEILETQRQVEQARELLERDPMELPDRAPERVEEQVARRTPGTGTPAEEVAGREVQDVSAIPGVDDAVRATVDTGDGTVERTIAFDEEAQEALEARQEAEVREQQEQLQEEFAREMEGLERNRESTAGIRADTLGVYEGQDDTEAAAGQADLRRAFAEESEQQQIGSFGARQEAASQLSEEVGVDLDAADVDLVETDGQPQIELDESAAQQTAAETDDVFSGVVDPVAEALGQGSGGSVINQARIESETGDTEISGTLPEPVQDFGDALGGAAQTVSEDVAQPAGRVVENYVQREFSAAARQDTLANVGLAEEPEPEAFGEESAAASAAGDFTRGAVEVFNLPAIGQTAVEVADVGATGVQRTIEGEGADFASEAGGQAASLAGGAVEQTLENPAQTAGLAAGGLVSTAGVTRAATGISSTAGRAVPYTFQPGEELLTSGATRALQQTRAGTRALDRVPGQTLDPEDVAIASGQRIRQGVSARTPESFPGSGATDRLPNVRVTTQQRAGGDVVDVNVAGDVTPDTPDISASDVRQGVAEAATTPLRPIRRRRLAAGRAIREAGGVRPAVRQRVSESVDSVRDTELSDVTPDSSIRERVPSREDVGEVLETDVDVRASAREQATVAAAQAERPLAAIRRRRMAAGQRLASDELLTPSPSDVLPDTSDIDIRESARAQATVGLAQLERPLAAIRSRRMAAGQRLAESDGLLPDLDDVDVSQSARTQAQIAAAQLERPLAAIRRRRFAAADRVEEVEDTAPQRAERAVGDVRTGLSDVFTEGAVTRTDAEVETEPDTPEERSRQMIEQRDEFQASTSAGDRFAGLVDEAPSVDIGDSVQSALDTQVRVDIGLPSRQTVTAPDIDEPGLDVDVPPGAIEAEAETDGGAADPLTGDIEAGDTDTGVSVREVETQTEEGTTVERVLEVDARAETETDTGRGVAPRAEIPTVGEPSEAIGAIDTSAVEDVGVDPATDIGSAPAVEVDTSVGRFTGTDTAGGLETGLETGFGPGLDTITRPETEGEFEGERERETEFERESRLEVEAEREQEFETELETETEAEREGEPFPFELNSTSSDRGGGAAGAGEEIITDFLNPLTGERLETDSEPDLFR